MLQRQTQPETRGATAKRGRSTGDVLVILLLLCVMSALVVSVLPMALVPPALSKLLILASLAAATAAILCRDRLIDGRLTHWDQAAVLLGLGLVAAFFTDVPAVNAVFESLSAAGLPEGQTGAAANHWQAV